MRRAGVLLPVLVVIAAACESPIDPGAAEGPGLEPDGVLAHVTAASHGPVVGSATGTLFRFVTNTNGSVTTVQMDVDARKYEDGTARGSYRYQAGGVAIRVDLHCMTLVGDNGAWIAGVITESTVGFLGHVSYFYTFDNGEGANAEPDIVSLVRVESQPGLGEADRFCAELPQILAPRNVDDGNISVRS